MASLFCSYNLNPEAGHIDTLTNLHGHVQGKDNSNKSLPTLFVGVTRGYCMPTVKLRIEAPGVYRYKWIRPPACMRGPASILGPASIRSFTVYLFPPSGRSISLVARSSGGTKFQTTSIHGTGKLRFSIESPFISNTVYEIGQWLLWITNRKS